jgi:hypothetical protein
MLEWTHQGAANRARVPPFLLFDKAGPSRDIRFRGLLALAPIGLAPRKTW